MSEIKEGDIVWVFPSSKSCEKLLVTLVRIYKVNGISPNFDCLVTDYLTAGRQWYTTYEKLKSLTPEETLELVTFGKILEVD